MEILASQFQSRSDLESYVRAEISTSPANWQKPVITGTKEELKKLLLTDQSSVFGLKVVITDDPTKESVQWKKNTPARRVVKR